MEMVYPLVQEDWISVEDTMEGILIEGEFGDNTMLFKIDGKMTLKAGKYFILPKPPKKQEK